MYRMMLIDGNSLLHRAFHALPLLQNSAGEYTNAVYGFIMMFQRAVREIEPTHGVVAFDVSRTTFRNAIYEGYKGTRSETPQELRGQFVYIKQILRAFGFHVIEKEGYEADDIIGTIAKEAAQKGQKVYIFTGDKDAFQLISPLVKVVLTRKGISETEIVDEKALFEKYTLTPDQIIDLKALMGDSSDNIPGVPGVGEKTAVKLLTEFTTLDKLYENANSISGKLGEKLRLNKELAYISKKLAKIDTNVSLELNIVSYELAKPDYDGLKNLYQQLGFKSLLKELPQEKMEIASDTHNLDIVNVNSVEDLHAFFAEQILACYVTYQQPLFEALPEEIVFASSKSACVLEYQSISPNIKSAIKDYLSSDKKKIFHDLKAASLLFSNAGFLLGKNCEDLSIMAYLLNPGSGKYTPEDIALNFLKASIGDNIAQSAQVLALAYPILLTKLQENDLIKLYREVDLPLTTVLADMEKTGIDIDENELKELSCIFSTAIAELKKEICQLADEEFNINSPKQLGKILFEKLNLPILKKGKTGYSTGAEVLEELADLHEIVSKVLEFRTLSKLNSTYVDGLQKAINARTSRMHTSFNQTITATGRLSSTEPNLQNIPVRVELGRKIRKAFIASPGTVLLAADYSQIELRILAHLSQDENFLDAFNTGQDIHTRTAHEVFDVIESDVTSEMRRRAKAVNFGIVYGISDYGLAKDLRIPRSEAKAYIANYFSRYAGIKKYIDNTIAEAKRLGYVSTIFNRKRYIPDILSSNRNVRNFGERMAMNSPIQGTAADIIKIAMINIFKAFVARGLTSKMLLQVHDELIFEIPEEELQDTAKLVKELMEGACILDVPVEVDLKVGKNWYLMEKYYGGNKNA